MNIDMEKKMKVYIICRYDNYDLRIQYVEKYFMQLGAEVTILTGDYNHILKKKANYKYNYDNIKYVHLTPYKSNLSYGRIAADVKFSKDVFSKICENKPDIVYSIIPPNMLIRKLSEYKRINPSALLIYDIYDLWPESFPSKLISNLRIWKNYRDKYIGNADHVFLECRYYKTFIRKHIKEQKLSVLYLTKRCEKMTKKYPDKDSLSFLYLGSINTIIDIESIVIFLSKVSKYKRVCVHIIGDGDRRNEFIKKLERSNIPYKYHGIIYDEKQKREIYSLCHFALNVYRRGVKIGLTMKSLDYFQNSLPVINMNIVDTEKLIKKYNCGYCINNNNMETIAKSIATIDEAKWMILCQNTYSLMKECFSEEAFFRAFSKHMNFLLDMNKNLKV